MCKCDIMKLYSLIKKTCNGSTKSLVDYALGNTVEASCSYLGFRDDEYYSLSNHMETSEQRYGVMKEAGASFVNDKMRYGHMAELVS